jgi:hypothetical protein
VPEDTRLYALALCLAIVLLGLVLFLRLHPASEAASVAPAAGLATASLAPPDAEEALIGRVATVVASRPVRVGCRLTSRLRGNLTELGEARTVPGSSTSGVVLLTPSICSNLLSFSHGLVASDRSCVAQNGPGLCSGAVDADLLALHTLAHETWHVRGIRDEATTDCYALQSVAAVAQTLGAAAVDAHALATYYAAHFDAIRRPPPIYRSAGCRDGGALDLRPSLAGWPG